MIEVNQWMEQYQHTVKKTFGSRILFIGLQGSYSRSEATENSDIDVVLILDKVSLTDIKQYKRAIKTLPCSSQICGFVSGKEELAGWYRPDLFQFYHDTSPYYGNLDAIIPTITKGDARSAVLIGACNLYHMCSHNYLHSDNMDTLKTLYKAAFFILQAKHYLESGNYIRSHAELKNVLSGKDMEVLQYAEHLKAADGPPVSPEQYSELMLQWTSELICNYKQEPAGL